MLGIEVEDEILGQEPKTGLKRERETQPRECHGVELSRAGAGGRSCHGFSCHCSGSVQILNQLD